jgi:predicted transcriptional regulator
LSVEQMAGRIGISRQSVYRWEVEQWRVTPDKQAAYAEALGPDVLPEMLWRLPDKAPSLDAMLIGQSEELKETAADIVRRLVRR